MNSPKLVSAFIARNPLTWAFHVLMLSIGVAIVLSVLLFSRAIDDRLTRDLAGVDLVVGAKGSPTQLILSTLFATDIPTGNIPLSAAEQISKSPLVRESVTLSLGDNISGYRIVGTQPKYASFYRATLDQGQFWTAPFEVVVGADAAHVLKLSVGSKFVGQHGLTGGGETHDEFPYLVVGILKPTGAAIDRLVLTDPQSVWRIHEHEAVEIAEESGQPAGPSRPREVTALLIRYKSAMGALMMPRQIVAMPDLQGAIPAQEAARMTALTGTGTDVLRWLGLGLLAISALGFCIALANAVHQRRGELALLRVLGIAPLSLVGIVVLEALMLGVLAGGLGVAIGRTMTWLGSTAIAQNGGIMLKAPQLGLLDVMAVGVAIALSFLAALIPAALAYRTDPAQALKGDIG